jgi:transcriptional/translational regulatory protein YebC/TACO1
VPGDEEIHVYTPREALAAVETALTEKGYKVADSHLIWIPKTELELDTEAAVQILGMLEKLEELDDIQAVASNLNITDEVAKAMETA